MATELSKGVPIQTGNTSAASKAIVQVVVDGSNNIYLYGSLDGTTYSLIETYTASAFKEVTMCKYFSFSGHATDHDDTSTSVGTGKVIIQELSGF